jgi:hypothetical protein
MRSEYSECAGMYVKCGGRQDRLGESLGEGAEGAVYRLQGTDGRVAKMFKQRKRAGKQTKLRRMVGDSMISPEDQPDIPWTAWPTEIVSSTADGSFLGYAMPYLDTEEYIDAQRYASQKLRWGKSSRREQYKPAINLTLTVHWLHQHGYAVGDLSEQNVRVNGGTVTLIDCDSYAVEGSDFVGSMEAPRYTPPEGRGESYRSVEQTDRFGVAVHIFQFLMAGFHPYQAVGERAVDGPLPEAIQAGDFPYGGSDSRKLAPPPQAPSFDRLPESVRDGFERSFSRGRKDPTARPSLQDWLRILTDESDFDVGGLGSRDDQEEKNETSTGDERNDKTRKNRERPDSDWQREIRQENSPGQTAATADGDTTVGASARARARGAQRTTATDKDVTEAETEVRDTDDDSDSHWADDIRDDQTDESDSTADQSKADQQSDGGISVPSWVVVTLLVLGILFAILVL